MKNDKKTITPADFEELASTMPDCCKYQCEYGKAIIERLDTIISLLRNFDHQTGFTPGYTPAKFEPITEDWRIRATKKDYAILLVDLAGATIDHGYDSNKVSKMLYYLTSEGIISVGDVLDTSLRNLTKVKGFGRSTRYSVYGTWDELEDMMKSAGYKLDGWEWAPISSGN